MSIHNNASFWDGEHFEETPASYIRPLEEEVRPRTPEPADLYIKPGPNERTIDLTRGYSTIVDLQDYECLLVFNWKVHITNDGKVYACRKGKNSDGALKGKTIYMHRQITGILRERGLVVDHVDGNSLDNRRCKLLVVQPVSNARNNECVWGVVGYRGVCEYRTRVGRHTKYQASMRIGKDEGESGYLGVFETAIEAARAYDSAVITALFEGRHIEMRFLRKLLNFPEDWIVDTQRQFVEEPVVEEEIPF